MKPKELEPIQSEDMRNINGYADTRRTYDSYRNTDCVIAYRKCFMGVVMLIRTKKEIMGFTILNENVGKWRRCEMQRRQLKDIFKLFGIKSDEKLVVLDDELYKLFERKLLFSGIDNDGR